MYKMLATALASHREEEESLHLRTDQEHQVLLARRDPPAGHSSSQNDRLVSPSCLPEAHRLTDGSGVLHNREGSLPMNRWAHRLTANDRDQHHRTPTHTETQPVTNPQRHTHKTMRTVCALSTATSYGCPLTHTDKTPKPNPDRN